MSILKAGTAAGLAALITCAVAVPAARALSPCVSPVVGIAFGQVARLNAVFTIPPPEPDDVCKVTLMFLDADGNELAMSGPEELTPGNSAFLELSARQAGVIAFGQRAAIRGVVEVDCSRGQASSESVLESLEIYDRLTGRTMVVLENFVQPPEPDVPAP